MSQSQHPAIGDAVSVLPPSHWTFWLPWLMVALAITIASHIPQPPRIDLGFEWSDKVLHILAYWIFGGTFLWMVLEWKAPEVGKRSFWITVIAVALFGCLDEIHQSFVPGREADVWDWTADVIGGIIAATQARWIFKGKQQWRKRIGQWRFFRFSIRRRTQKPEREF